MSVPRELETAARIAVPVVSRLLRGQSAERPSVSVSVPKDHPGLARLVAAAENMPSIELIQQSGVAIRRKQMATQETVQEFFDALRDIIGDHEADVLERNLGLHEDHRSIASMDTASIMNIVQMFAPLAGFVDRPSKGEGRA